MQSLFTTTYQRCRANHPVFDGKLHPATPRPLEHINVSRRGKSVGPVDAALEEQGLRRHIALVVPNPYGIVRAAGF